MFSKHQTAREQLRTREHKAVPCQVSEQCRACAAGSPADQAEVSRLFTTPYSHRQDAFDFVSFQCIQTCHETGQMYGIGCRRAPRDVHLVPQLRQGLDVDMTIAVTLILTNV